MSIGDVTGEFISNIAVDIIDTLRGLVEAFNQLLIQGIGLLGTMLQGFIELRFTDGGPAVYAVWKVIRDICNMLFLLVLIAVAFGTIFNTLKPNPYYWRGALLNVLIAAVAINFSLAVGQTVVTLGNSATQVVLGLLGNQDLGAQIATAVNVKGIIANTNTPPVDISALTPSTTGNVKFSPVQEALVQAWAGQAQAGSAGAGDALSLLKLCLEGIGTPGNANTVDSCFRGARAIVDVRLGEAIARDTTAQSRTIVSLDEFAQYWSSAWDAGSPFGGKITTLTRSESRDLTTVATQLMSLLLKSFMLIALLLSFLAICLFMVARVPIIWFLLAISAAPFFAIAIPNSTHLRLWFRNILGWSVFGPLYLLNIYIGMYMLSKQGPLLASMSSQGGDLPFFASLGSILFFAIACFIFIGGAKFSMDWAFGLISVGGGALRSAAGYMGLDEKGGYGLKTTARITGLASRYEGAAAGLGAVYQRRVTQPLARRDEDVRARYQARFGDPRAQERLNRQRVDEDIKNKKIKTVDDAAAALSKLTPQGREYMLKELERNDPLLASRMASQGFYTDKNGNKMTQDQVLARNATRMSTEDWSSYLEDVVKRGQPMSPEMQQILQSRVRKPDQLAQLRAAAGSNPQVLALIDGAVASGGRGSRRATAGGGGQPTAGTGGATAAGTTTGSPGSEAGVQQSAAAARANAERAAAAGGGTVRSQEEVRRDMEAARQRGQI